MTDRQPYECPTWPRCSHECLREGQTIVQADRLAALLRVAEVVASVRERMELHARHPLAECPARQMLEALAALEALP